MICLRNMTFVLFWVPYWTSVDLICLRQCFPYTVYPVSPTVYGLQLLCKNSFCLARSKHYVMTSSARAESNGLSLMDFVPCFTHQPLLAGAELAFMWFLPETEQVLTTVHRNRKMKILVDLATKQDQPCAILESSWPDTKPDTLAQSTYLSTWNVALPIPG